LPTAPRSLSGKTAIITGSTSGIGLGIATRFRRAIGVTPATWRRERKEVFDGSPDVVLSSRATASHTNTNVPQGRLLAA
jgi:NAD(P)-dependent dehydrogenase (short-subunit alcohol dehydrogenase family)